MFKNQENKFSWAIFREKITKKNFYAIFFRKNKINFFRPFLEGNLENNPIEQQFGCFLKRNRHKTANNGSLLEKRLAFRRIEFIGNYRLFLSVRAKNNVRA